MKPLPGRPRQRAQVDVSLTIVNVVLLLILFFLVAGQSINPFADRLALPETERLPLDFLPEPVLVIQKDGRWELNTQPIEPNKLAPALAALDGDVVLHVLMDRDAYGRDLIRLTQRPDLASFAIKLVTLRKETKP